jgi:hypothetical protein
MKQLRDLVADLVERRLWPVAVALVVALVGVPVLMGRGGDAPAPPVTPPAAGATGAAATPAVKAEVTVDTTTEPVHREPAKDVRDPFKAPAVPKAKTVEDTPSASAPAASTATPSASSPTSGAGGASTPSGSTTPATPSTGSTSGTTTPKPAAKPKTSTTATPKAEDAQDTYHVDLRFGVNGAEAKKLEDVARLSPLPSLTDPFFVFLGVIETKAHQKRAVFLVSSDATPNGEGACHPTKTDCESVELAVGQTAFFDYAAPDGTATQYQLELTRIRKTEVRAEAKAAAAVARHSMAGAELLRDAAVRDVRAAAGARAYRYVPALGSLVRAKRRHVSARAAATGKLIPGLALVSRKYQPGIPVWHSPKK